MSNTKNIELDQLYGHFDLIFDQQMELYKEWTDNNVPEEIIIWWVSYFLIDLILEDHDEDYCRVHFNRMINEHDKHH